MIVDLKELLEGFGEHVRGEFASMPEVRDVGDDLDLDSLAIDARVWASVNDVVAVVADLKNSTQLGTGKRAASTASIYEAAVRPIVETFDEFEAGDITIQGDGAFGVFWGDGRYERAMCAGITIKTFSERHLVDRLEKKWPEAPETGYKVGVAASRILVKRVGIPRSDNQEEVWAGHAVNYATKAAQVANRHELVVTGDVWDFCETNDYIAFTCGCGAGPSASLWEDITIDKLPEDDPDRTGRKLTSKWCEIHGPEFCQAILDGKTTRDDVDAIRALERDKAMSNALRVKAKIAREQRRGLRHVGAKR